MIANTKDSKGPSGEAELFGSGRREGAAVSLLPWILAGAAVVVIVLGLLISGRQRATPAAATTLPLDRYASFLPISGVTMSESTSLSGGKSTFIDGHIRNTGTQTVTDATLQVIFDLGESMPPQRETLPLTLIRTREPYVDTQPVRAAPLKPGDEREFRLIFEDIQASWNQQLPVIRVASTTLR